MKIRAGFVSNSSSSSFIIKTCDLTAEQYHKILNHIQHAQEHFPQLNANLNDEWRISTIGAHAIGHTGMDNFDMGDFLELIGISDDKISWGEY